MYEPRPNARFDHGYAIVRLDRDRLQRGIADEHVATVTKVVCTMEKAESEVERLNGLNQAKGYLYYWEQTKLERIDVPRTKAEHSGTSVEELPRTDETRPAPAEAEDRASEMIIETAGSPGRALLRQSEERHE